MNTGLDIIVAMGIKINGVNFGENSLYFNGLTAAL